MHNGKPLKLNLNTIAECTLSAISQQLKRSAHYCANKCYCAVIIYAVMRGNATEINTSRICTVKVILCRAYSRDKKKTFCYYTASLSMLLFSYIINIVRNASTG